MYWEKFNKEAVMKVTQTLLGILATTMISVVGGLHAAEAGVKTIYGLSEAAHFNTTANGKFYVQAGTFKSAQKAHRYQRQLMNTHHQPVRVEQSGIYHVVVIGPMTTAAQVRAIGGARVKPTPKQEQLIHSEPTHPSTNQDQQVMAYQDEVVQFPQGPDRIEVIGAGGIANLRAANSHLGVTSSEVDLLLPNNKNKWNNFTAQAGVGYVHYFPGAVEYSESRQWFPSIEPQVNGYYIERTNIKGDVWRYGSQNFNDMTYTMPIQSTRLMLDGALTIVSQQQYSLYAIGGIGNAWNRASYRDADRDSVPCIDQRLSLNASTHSGFAWEVGAGLQYAFNHRAALSLQYLYADLGTAKMSSGGNTGTITTPVVVPSGINLTSHAVLLGLHVTL